MLNAGDWVVSDDADKIVARGRTEEEAVENAVNSGFDTTEDWDHLVLSRVLPAGSYIFSPFIECRSPSLGG